MPELFFLDPRQALEQGGLAHSVTPDHADDPPGVERDGNPLEDRHAPLVPRIDSPRLDGGKGGGGTGKALHQVGELRRLGGPEPAGLSLRVGQPQESLRVPFGGDGTAFEEQVPVGDAREVGEPVLGDDHGRPARLGFRYEGGELLHGGRIQIARRLVEDVDARLAGPCAREGHRLHLAPGELEDAPAHQALYAELTHDVAHSPVHLLPGNAEVLHAKRDLAGRVKVEELSARVLENAARQRRELPILQVVDIPARYEDLSRPAALIEPTRQPVDDPGRGGLSAARFPAKNDAFARRDGKAHVVDRRGIEPRIGEGDASELDGVFRHSSPPIPWLALATTRSKQQAARIERGRKSTHPNRGAL